ncbi:interleukin-10 receptor subunit alpha-like [Pristis pectinata]|uniref:interleukin-10 receptor subunit alpha-like n=1 Tax=Pristis pectinata TaxID=685728 RepID=UPI00223CDFD7|nr:interleukin-10 receptor subunit alpha-like [Pristis pectinata]
MELQITTHLLLWITLSGAETTLWPPENPHFVSVNTENIFHWSPARNDSQQVRYDVQYCRYGYDEDCIPVPHCTGTSHHYCDLTEETWDFNISFIAGVRSVIGNTTSKWERTNHFKPFDSTSLGLPSFDTKADRNEITVRIFPPTLHTAKRNRSMEELYPDSLKYIIYIRANDTERSMESQSSGELFTTKVRPGNIYCIRVRAKVNGDERKSNFTEEKCVDVPTPNPDLERLIDVVFGVIGAVIALIVVCFCLVMICQNYLKKQRTTPAVLKSFEKNKKFLNIMDYRSLTEDVVVQKVFADDAHHGVTRTLEQDDPWLDQKIKEASSVDSGIDIGSHLSDRMMLLSEPLNRYMQQTPDSSSLQSTNPECGQNSCQPVSFSSVHIPDATSEPGDSTGSISISGYQRQMPRTNAASEQEASSTSEQTIEDSPPCLISISDISITEDLTRGFLSLGDVMLMENGF